MVVRSKYPEYQAALDARYRRRVKHLKAYQMKVGCAECGYKENAAALQFAHIVPVRNNQSLRVYQHCRTGKLSTLMKQVRLCRVLCANCHCIETHKDKLALERWTK